MTMDSEAGAGLAFDNFNRFVETLSGKDTLYDTVGIAYQIWTNDQCQGAEPEKSQPVKAVKNNKRRPAFQASGLDIEPYRKKPNVFKSNAALWRRKKENCTDHLLFTTMVELEVNECIYFQQKCSNVVWMKC